MVNTALLRLVAEKGEKLISKFISSSLILIHSTHKSFLKVNRLLRSWIGLLLNLSNEETFSMKQTLFFSLVAFLTLSVFGLADEYPPKGKIGYRFQPEQFPCEGGCYYEFPLRAVRHRYPSNPMEPLEQPRFEKNRDDFRKEDDDFKSFRAKQRLPFNTYRVIEIVRDMRVTNSVKTTTGVNYAGTVIREIDYETVEVRWDSDSTLRSAWLKRNLSPAIPRLNGIYKDMRVVTRVVANDNYYYRGRVREIFASGRVSLVVDNFTKPSLDWNTEQLEKDEE